MIERRIYLRKMLDGRKGRRIISNHHIHICMFCMQTFVLYFVDIFDRNPYGNNSFTNSNKKNVYHRILSYLKLLNIQFTVDGTLVLKSYEESNDELLDTDIVFDWKPMKNRVCNYMNMNHMNNVRGEKGNGYTCYSMPGNLCLVCFLFFFFVEFLFILKFCDLEKCKILKSMIIDFFVHFSILIFLLC